MNPRFYRALVVIMAVLMMAAAFAPGVAGASYAYRPAVVNNPNPSDRLNLRASPSSSAASLGRYYNGVVVDVLQDNAYGTQWWQVRIGATIGYMQSAYLRYGGEGTVPSASPTVYVTASSVNIREKTNTSARIVGTARNGKALKVLGIAGSWYHIQNGGVIGYVSGSYVSEAPSGGSAGGSSDPGSGSFASLPSFPSNRKVGYPVTSGLSVPVYSAPSSYALRGADGRASVGLDSTFYIYGYSDWNSQDGTRFALIAYTLTAGGNRIGYIDSNDIFINGSASPLIESNWGRASATTTQRCNVTDDPMGKQATLTSLGAGARVSCLARYIDSGVTWVYVSGVSGGRQFRGFIKAGYLRLD
ncbi:MAG: SH3 domain-containing protein [Oscillospiraceae bacterium]|jgi:SH3-like domain-containing protein|nr:SH3 domain-containing protein [Oscillospiraceae bacterium]